MKNFSNKDAADFLNALAFLMEVEGGQNPFRIRSFRNAADEIESESTPLSERSFEDLEKINGIGKGIAGILVSFFATGTCPEWEEICGHVPESLLELRSIRGLGPGRIKKLWKEGGIKSLRSLKRAYAQHPEIIEKILGKTTSNKIRHEVEFLEQSVRKKLFFQIAAPVEDFLDKTRTHCPDLQPDGTLFTQEPIIDTLSFFTRHPEKIPRDAILALSQKTNLPVVVNQISSDPDDAFRGTSEYVSSLYNALHNISHIEKSELLKRARALPPELRNRPISELESCDINTLVDIRHIRGIVHSHTTWSDGMHGIEDMLLACQNNNWEWLVISDHSRSAFYANGLTEERIEEQHKEIEHLNNKHKSFTLIRGIECDILRDGSLDYSDEILKKFEIVIASVHSGLQMKKEEATRRLIRAIEHPHVHILGHPTGRLLLEREGYPIDHEKIIDACAAHGVSIEMNVNPYRLDIDHSWIKHCMNKGVKICLSPDAHSVNGLKDIYYGCIMARKGLLSKDFCLNVLSAKDFLSFVRKK